MYELIITEKPAAAKKIAEALADGIPLKENINEVPYYKLTHGKKEIVVACSVGHLYGLAEKENKGWAYPIFDIEWKPVSETAKSSAFTKKYLDAIKKLCINANAFTVATDYDIEGEVIGFNIIKYACRQKDAYRMKFSTLTNPDLISSYENKMLHLDWPQANAGIARHFLDYYNGINYSRALTSAIKTAGTFKVMSTGRVQGPTLKIIVDRELEIKAFKPIPYWQLQLLCKIKGHDVTALHKEDKFWDKSQAEEIFNKIKAEKKGIITKAEKTKISQAPPVPFDLTALQIEAYSCLGIPPNQTLSIAQELYISGYISYPRTSSQQLPPAIGYNKIISEFLKHAGYKELAKKLLAKTILKPNNGKKADPAHPAIFPTGIIPNLEGRQARLYDLIVKRFFATFGEPAIRQRIVLGINVKGEEFIATGITTLEKGWHVFYEPYLKLEEKELPDVNINEPAIIIKIDFLDKETQPPKRYTPASIIKALEKKNLGTKSTRSEIVETLYKRGYINGQSITSTELGIKTIEALERHCPKIIDAELTRHFEIEMEEIREDKKSTEEVLSEAKSAITKIIEDFKHHEKDIGKALLIAERETRHQQSLLGKCPNCGIGEILIKRSKKGNFAACNKYPDCKTIFSLPKKLSFKATDKICEKCKSPIVQVIRNKRRQELCINSNCKSKQLIVENKKVDTICPKCKQGKLLIRSSIYGSFLACSEYPKCKYTESMR